MGARRRASSSPAAPRAARVRQGKRLRQKVPRSAHGRWTPPKDRRDPIAVLEAADRDRRPALLPIRYGRMAASPFGFLRGAAPVMAADLAGTPVTGLEVQMAGDAHVSNFGLFATPERDLVFDVNDFDETLRGPWEWDLKRLGTSLVLAGRSSGLAGHVLHRAVRASVRSYRDTMAEYARQPYLEVWYAHLDLATVGREVRREGSHLFRQEIDRARERTGFHAFPKLTEGRGGRFRIRDDPPLIQHYEEPALEAEVRELFDRYPATLPPERRILLDRYRLVDVAQKVVGIGSVGTRCAIGLYLADPDVLDPLFLQGKEAGPSAYEPYLGASPCASHAERVVVGQRSIQEASDLFLGWGSTGGRDYYVRQLRDMKFTADILAFAPASILGHAELCGATLARAHARTGDAAKIAGYLGSGPEMEEALPRFAEAYARQTELDHARLLEAIARGRLPAAPVG